MLLDLKQMTDSFERLIGNKEAQLSITIETGCDEAGLIGTRDAYFRLAKEVLEFVALAERDELAKWNLGGKQLPGSTSINRVFDSTCEVVLDTTCLASSEQDSREVSEYYKRISPRG